MNAREMPRRCGPALACTIVLFACTDRVPAAAGDTSTSEGSTSSTTTTTTTADTSSSTTHDESSSSTGEPVPCVPTPEPTTIAWSLGPEELASASTGLQGRLAAVAIDSVGNVLTAVTLDAVPARADVRIRSFTPDGQLRWQVDYGGTAGLDDRALALVVLDDGSSYAVVSEVTSELVARGGSIITASTVVLRIGPAGERLWRLERPHAPGDFPGAGGEPLAVAARGPDDHAILVDYVLASDALEDLPTLVEIDRHGNVVRERVVEESGIAFVDGVGVDDHAHVALAHEEFVGRGLTLRMDELDGEPVWSRALVGGGATIAVTSAGETWATWADDDGWHLARHGHDGTVLAEVTAGLQDPRALAIDCDGILVGDSDSTGPRVVAVDDEGALRWAAELEPKIFWSTTTAIALDSERGPLLGGLVGPPGCGLGPWLGRIAP
jgi:hypothetical protein